MCQYTSNYVEIMRHTPRWKLSKATAKCQPIRFHIRSSACGISWSILSIQSNRVYWKNISYESHAKILTHFNVAILCSSEASPTATQTKQKMQGAWMRVGDVDQFWLIKYLSQQNQVPSSLRLCLPPCSWKWIDGKCRTSEKTCVLFVVFCVCVPPLVRILLVKP